MRFFKARFYATKRDFSVQITQPSKNQNKSKKAHDLQKGQKDLKIFRQIAIELSLLNLDYALD